MGANNNPNKTTALVLNQKISEGVDKYFSKVKSFTIAGTTYTPKSLMEVLNAEVDASKAVDATRAQYQEEVATHRAAKASAIVLRGELKSYILGNFGKKAVQMLGDFGMSVPKSPGKKTVETKAKAIAQSQATREARHTMGKNQKKSIKGVVPQTATAAATPSSSAPAETPVQAAPAATPAQVAQPPQAAPTTASH